MDPASVLVGAFDVEPQSSPLDHLRNMPVKELGYLRSSDVWLTQHRRDRGDGRDTLAQCSGQSIFFGVLGVIGGSGRFATQSLQSVIPRTLQMMHTNVPQSAQG
jgi:hypothetical protein